MRVARRAAVAAVLLWLTAGVFAAAQAEAAMAPAAAAATSYPNPSCLVTTVPLYSPAMWQAARGKKPEANTGVANWGSNTQTASWWRSSWSVKPL